MPYNFDVTTPEGKVTKAQLDANRANRRCETLEGQIGGLEILADWVNRLDMAIDRQQRTLKCLIAALQESPTRAPTTQAMLREAGMILLGQRED